MAMSISSASGTRLLQSTQHGKEGLNDTYQQPHPSPEMEMSHLQAYSDR